MVKLRTEKCPGCGERADFDVTQEELDRWIRGAKVQFAFPNMAAGDRERLISGYCDKCWDELFPDEEE